MPHKGASTQCHNQQVLAKPCHQPSNRDQQAREKLKQKVKIKSQAYIQLGEEALQIVHKTFAPDIPVILHLPALLDNTIDSNTPRVALLPCQLRGPATPSLACAPPQHLLAALAPVGSSIKWSSRSLTAGHQK